MFSTLMKRVAVSSLLTCSAMAVADQSDYKLMVIDQSTQATVDTNRQYELAFNQCALSVQAKNFTEAETLCSKAISLLSKSKVPAYKRRELTSFALSNRGVSRMMANNDAAGLSDFYEAAQIADSVMVSHNLSRAKENLSL